MFLLKHLSSAINIRNQSPYKKKKKNTKKKHTKKHTQGNHRKNNKLKSLNQAEVTWVLCAKQLQK